MRSNMFSNLYREYDRGGHTREWLKEKVEDLRPRPNSLITRNPEQRRNFPLVGKMYLFLYEAENKNTMSYFDQFPLVIPIDTSNYRERSRKRKRESFNGLNLHYTHPRHREYIIESLYKNENFKINLYNLSRRRNGQLIKPLIKTYTLKFIRSKFLEIPLEEYDLALVHRTEKFTKKHKSVVWRDTGRRIISG